MKPPTISGDDDGTEMAQAATSRRTLRDLLTEGLFEPNYPTMGEGEMPGAVKISAAGLRELRELGEDGE